MSLINDALKQAKQTQQQNPPPTPPLQFRPVEPEQTNPGRSPLVVVGLVSAVVLVLALGGIFVWLAEQKSAGDLTVAARSANESATGMSDGSGLELVAPPSAAIPPVTIPVEPETNTLPGAGATEQPPQPLMPKLQGISFHPTRPLAVVNGKTVVTGDRVSGFRVLAITRSSVTLGSATATNVLSLSE